MACLRLYNFKTTATSKAKDMDIPSEKVKVLSGQTQATKHVRNHAAVPFAGGVAHTMLGLRPEARAESWRTVVGKGDNP